MAVGAPTMPISPRPLMLTGSLTGGRPVTAAAAARLAAPPGMMYQLAFLVWVLVSVALPQGHLEGVQDEPCLLRCGR